MRHRNQLAAVSPIEVAGALPQPLYTTQRCRMPQLEAASVQEQEGVGGRGPLGAVQAVGPGAVGVLSIEELSTATGGGYQGPFSIDLVGGRIEEITSGLLPDRRVTGQQHSTMPASIVSSVGSASVWARLSRVSGFRADNIS